MSSSLAYTLERNLSRDSGGFGLNDSDIFFVKNAASQRQVKDSGSFTNDNTNNIDNPISYPIAIPPTSNPTLEVQPAMTRSPSCDRLNHRHISVRVFEMDDEDHNTVWWVTGVDMFPTRLISKQSVLFSPKWELPVEIRRKYGEDEVYVYYECRNSRNELDY